MKLHAISAVFRRNVSSFFSGALGYLVIVVFVFVCAVLAFSERFFTNNLATLDQLSEWYPELLLFLVPAITMSIWADERKQNTDELLFTLPASDVEILLGKYLACLANYTIALLFSLPLVFVLSTIGEPDRGVVITTYLGYWFAGAALLSAGMFASSLTRSTTVAFVVGVLVAAIPVFFSGTIITSVTGFLADSVADFGWLAATFNWMGGFFGSLADSMLLEDQLRGFTEGLVPLASILYFVSFAAFMLYLNFVVITKRHWSSGRKTQMEMQYGVRIVALLAVLISFNSILQDGNAYVPSGIDLSAEKVHTLSDVTREMIAKAEEEEESIIIHAFVSPEMPEELAVARKELESLLRQYDRLGGNAITVRVVDVEHAGEAEREAKTRGITPINHKLSDREGRVVQQEIYFGVVVEGSKNKVVVPHLDDGGRIEYELTRSLATVMQAEKLRVGILRTDARVLGMGKDWYFDRFVEEMRKQYELVDVPHADLEKMASDDAAKKKKKDAAANKKTGDSKDEADRKVDVLIVVQPSSLTKPVADNLVKYIEAGKPTLIFNDPLPFYLLYDQARIPEPLRGDFNEILAAPKLPRAQPRSFFAIEMIPQSRWEQLLTWWREEGSRQQYRSQPQFEFALMRKMGELYPEAVPQIAGLRPSPKVDGGEATTILDALGLSWKYDQVVTDSYQPHPDFNPAIPPQVVEKSGATWPFQQYGQRDNAFLFLSRGNGNVHALNASHALTKDLQEVLTLYSGGVFMKKDGKTEVVSLLQTSKSPGTISWDELTVRQTQTVGVRDPSTGTIRLEEREVDSQILNEPQGLRGFPKVPQAVMADNPARVPAGKTQTVAVLVTGKGEEKKEASKIKAVYVADVDMIADVAFKQEEALGQRLDNMAFVKNVVEYLAGDERFIALRSRKQRPRSLVAVQEAVAEFRLDRLEAEREAKEASKDEEKKAQERFDKKLKEIRGNKGLGFFERGQMLSVALRTERERLKAKKKQLDEDLKQQLAELKDKEDREIRDYQTRVRAVAIVITPLPAFLLGLFVLCVRWFNERRHVVSSRRV